MAEIDWKREFEAMGSKAVRGVLISTRWDDDKRSAAREWLERADAAEWQASRGPDAAGAEAKHSLDGFRRYTWVYYVAGAAFGLLGLSQLIK